MLQLVCDFIITWFFHLCYCLHEVKEEECDGRE